MDLRAGLSVRYCRVIRISRRMAQLAVIALIRFSRGFRYPPTHTPTPHTPDEGARNWPCRNRGGRVTYPPTAQCWPECVGPGPHRLETDLAERLKTDALATAAETIRR